MAARQQDSLVEQRDPHHARATADLRGADGDHRAALDRDHRPDLRQRGVARVADAEGAVAERLERATRRPYEAAHRSVGRDALRPRQVDADVPGPRQCAVRRRRPVPRQVLHRERRCAWYRGVEERRHDGGHGAGEGHQPRTESFGDP